MGEKIMRYSDLSGSVAQEESDLVRIVVKGHSAIGSQAVQIEALPDETEGIQSKKNYVILEIEDEDDDHPRTVIMEEAAFNKLATDEPMETVLKNAKPAVSRTAKPAASGKKIDYATLEHAGKPKKGKTSDAEKKIVQEHFDEVNERLKRDGMRVLDLNNADHVSRYSLEELAKERLGE